MFIRKSKEMKTGFFTPRTKMADMIAVNHTLILVVPRFGIPLGFGEKSVQELCAQYGQDVGFFLLVCNLYTFSNYPVSLHENVDLSGLIPYLEASHRYYLNERLPHIVRHLTSIGDRAGQQYAAVLHKFIDDYRKEVTDHFDYEEREVFPCIQQLQKGKGSAAQIAATFLDSHSDLVESLSDLPQILYKYLPGNPMVEELSELVFSILQLSSDLEKHALLEEKVLMPYVTQLSAQASGQPVQSAGKVDERRSR